MMRHKDFGAFILTHGRADRVYTVDTLKQSGYTGPLVFVIDDEDDQRQLYFEKFGRENVVIFSKSEVVKTFDEGDNFNDRRAIIYARNACFEIARERGFKYFIELDDDYTNFSFRFDEDRIFTASTIRDLDRVLDLMLDYYISMPNCLSLAMAQGGDYIGGGEGTFGKEIRLHRKAMNSFICSVDRPFKFVGRVNEDVNTYTSEGFRGGAVFDSSASMPESEADTKQPRWNVGNVYRQRDLCQDLLFGYVSPERCEGRRDGQQGPEIAPSDRLAGHGSADSFRGCQPEVAGEKQGVTCRGMN